MENTTTMSAWVQGKGASHEPHPDLKRAGFASENDLQVSVETVAERARRVEQQIREMLESGLVRTIIAGCPPQLRAQFEQLRKNQEQRETSGPIAKIEHVKGTEGKADAKETKPRSGMRANADVVQAGLGADPIVDKLSGINPNVASALYSQRVELGVMRGLVKHLVHAYGTQMRTADDQREFRELERLSSELDQLNNETADLLSLKPRVHERHETALERRTAA